MLVCGFLYFVREHSLLLCLVARARAYNSKHLETEAEPWVELSVWPI